MTLSRGGIGGARAPHGHMAAVRVTQVLPLAFICYEALKTGTVWPVRPYGRRTAPRGAAVSDSGSRSQLRWRTSVMTVLIGCVWTGPGAVTMYKAACTAGRGLEPRTARSTLPHPWIIVR